MGERVGNYVLLEKLGRGGMGTVYRAENPHIGREVAIKVLAPELTHQPKAAERFLVEGRAVARIRHPSVIDIYDFGTTEGGLLYLVMEHLRGGDLGKLLDRRGAMPPEEVLSYLVPIGGALQAAHDQGVVHRDLKPENIFILEAEPLALKIFDFGLAKLLENAKPTQSMTALGTVMGTPLTIAPEQAAGDHHRVGPATDIYSLGVILYWMLCGEPPFHDEPVPVLLSRHILEPPPPLRQKRSTIPEPIAALVERCLAKEPAQRPAKAWEVVEGFARALGAAVPRPVSMPGRTTRPVHRETELSLAKTGQLPELADADGATLAPADATDRVGFPASAELEPTAPGPVDPVASPSPERVSIGTTLSGSTGEIAPRRRRGPGLPLGIAGGAVAIAAIVFLLARGPSGKQGGEPHAVSRPPLPPDRSLVQPDRGVPRPDLSPARVARPEPKLDPVRPPRKKPRPVAKPEKKKRPALEKKDSPEPKKKTLGDRPPPEF